MLPDRPDIALRVEHFVGNAGKRAIAKDRIVADPAFPRRIASAVCFFDMQSRLHSCRTPQIERQGKFR